MRIPCWPGEINVATHTFRLTCGICFCVYLSIKCSTCHPCYRSYNSCESSNGVFMTAFFPFYIDPAYPSLLLHPSSVSSMLRFEAVGRRTHCGFFDCICLQPTYTQPIHPYIHSPVSIYLSIYLSFSYHTSPPTKRAISPIFPSHHSRPYHCESPLPPYQSPLSFIHTTCPHPPHPTASPSSANSKTKSRRSSGTVLISWACARIRGRRFCVWRRGGRLIERRGMVLVKGRGKGVLRG